MNEQQIAKIVEQQINKNTENQINNDTISKIIDDRVKAALAPFDARIGKLEKKVSNIPIKKIDKMFGMLTALVQKNGIAEEAYSNTEQIEIEADEEMFIDTPTPSPAPKPAPKKLVKPTQKKR
jgi:hypothetical protein